jgi:hypothetical protein
MPPAERMTSFLALTTICRAVWLLTGPRVTGTKETPVAVVPFSTMLVTLDPVTKW